MRASFYFSQKAEKNIKKPIIWLLADRLMTFLFVLRSKTTFKNEVFGSSAFCVL